VAALVAGSEETEEAQLRLGQQCHQTLTAQQAMM
jgi:hypothetical protein